MKIAIQVQNKEHKAINKTLEISNRQKDNGSLKNSYKQTNNKLSIFKNNEISNDNNIYSTKNLKLSNNNNNQNNKSQNIPINKKKTIEKMVDCNLINLNLRNSFHIHSPHSSPRNTFYSINNSKTSRTSNLGKTHYGFFRNKERYTLSRSLISCENKNKF